MCTVVRRVSKFLDEYKVYKLLELKKKTAETSNIIRIHETFKKL